MENSIPFVNTLYKDEWMQEVPRHPGYYYKNGVYSQAYIDRKLKYAVYDGATNFIGYVNTDGTFEVNSANPQDEYSLTFLESVKRIISGDGTADVSRENSTPFVNFFYKAEWIQEVPNQPGVYYKHGTYSQTFINYEIKYAVYDGATNFIGYVKEDGTLEPNSANPNDEYALSFLECVRKILGSVK